MKNLGTMSALLVIFVGAFYIGKSTSGQKKNKVSIIYEKKFKENKRSKKLLKKRNPQSFSGDQKEPKEQALKKLKNKDVKEQISYFLKKDKYKEMMSIMELEKEDRKTHPLIVMIIGLEESSIVSHNRFIEMKNNLFKFLKKNPEESYKQITNLLRSRVGKETPALRGSLMVAASFIPGKEEAIKDMALDELKSNTIRLDKRQIIPGKNNKKINLKGSMDQVAVVKAYEAYLSASHLGLENVQEDTLDILKLQTNLTLRRNVAIIYDRTFPHKREEMLIRMKEEGINLMKVETPRKLKAALDDDYYDSDEYYDDYGDDEEV
jgi:hypothetical protein